MPYWIWRSCVRRYESPIDSAPATWPVDRWRAVSVRLNAAARPASRSSSELNVNVPSRFDARFCVFALYDPSVDNLMRCLFASSNHDSVFWNDVLIERELELRF